MGFAVPREKDIQATCTQWLELFGAVVVRTNSGGMKIGRRYVKFNDQPGCSDTLVCLPGGTFLALELKRPGRDQTDPLRKAKQQSFQSAVVRAGGLALIVRSLEELKAALAAEGYDVDTRH